MSGLRGDHAAASAVPRHTPGLYRTPASSDDPVRQFGQHQPLNRESQRFKCEGIALSVSMLADQVGAGAFAVRPIFELIEAYVLSTGSTVMTPRYRSWRKGKQIPAGFGPTFATIGHSAGDASAARFYASRDRRGEHPARHLQNFAGILQADAKTASCRRSLDHRASRRRAWCHSAEIISLCDRIIAGEHFTLGAP
ncbi:transposase [Bradyrhizobium sp. LMG 9283]|uniref:IS66 family transposase n=1 Tax=Bradyrhizobium sp. LMG 9283 TaxID=592064 RepID=UPI00388F8C63